MVEESEQSWSIDGGESSDDEVQSSGRDTNEQEKAEEEAIAELTRRETMGVQMWRVFTLLTLVAVSVAVSTITFRLLQAQDVDEFEDSVSIALFIFSPQY
jgi:hypothetical protein